ncbi:hypothetical protein ACOMCU_01590 [Lysinibacillus sp. UGB7]|uniref:hypothetical protein n=1 Tax=Lysinibacillus sp. UGB7 TaxID=3411039 RepID=UPI003B8070CC
MARQGLFLGTHSLHQSFLEEAASHRFDEVQVETVHHYFSGFGQTELYSVYYEGTSFPEIWYSPREINLSKFTFTKSGNVYYLITHSSVADPNIIRRELERDVEAEREALTEYAKKIDFSTPNNVFTKPFDFQHMFDNANGRGIEAVFTDRKQALIYMYEYFSLGSFKRVDSYEEFLAYCSTSIDELFQRIEDEENDFGDDFDEIWDQEWRQQWLEDFNEVLSDDEKETVL